MVDYSAASASTPWFTQSPQNTAVAADAQAAASGNTPQGNSITSERGILNQQVNGVAGDLTSQSDALATALNAIATAINAKPSA